ncbi:MAG: toll/interleukin-1 receptor domain-containing protein [Chloroflexota bacterium]
MPYIFISYRRADSQHITGRIYDHLRQFFAEQKVFRDTQNLAAGDIFSSEIQEAATSCKILIAVIGTQWLTITDEFGQRRLDNPNDWVRQEITCALSRGNEAVVVPLLVDGALLPQPEALPNNLKPLLLRQVQEVRERDFAYDMKRLMKAIYHTFTIEERIREAYHSGKAEYEHLMHVMQVPEEFRHDRLDEILDESPIRARLFEEVQAAVLKELIEAIAENNIVVLRVGCVQLTRQDKNISLAIECDVLTSRAVTWSELSTKGWIKNQVGQFTKHYPALDETYDIGAKQQILDIALEVILANGYTGKPVDRLPVIYVSDR